MRQPTPDTESALSERAGDRPSRSRRAWLAAAVALAGLLASPGPAAADEFDETLARVDEALRSNRAGVSAQALDSCLARRNSAVRLHDMGESARALRRLQFCIDTLKVREKKAAVRPAAPSMEEMQARAAREVEKALSLTPDLEKGLEIYRSCAMCHMPEGWGLKSGVVPQLAGQHRKVIIKQLADIRAGNRHTPPMLPYSSVEAIGGPQAVADVAGYIDTLEISVENGKGPGDDLELGERLYRENCARCHGASAEGDGERFMPRIQSQHYGYLVRQFERIRDGKRHNADPEMVAQIGDFEEEQMQAVLDYVSRLQPPPEFRAPPDWKNPDFAE